MYSNSKIHTPPGRAECVWLARWRFFLIERERENFSRLLPAVCESISHPHRLPLGAQACAPPPLAMPPPPPPATSACGIHKFPLLFGVNSLVSARTASRSAFWLHTQKLDHTLETLYHPVPICSCLYVCVCVFVFVRVCVCVC